MSKDKLLSIIIPTYNCSSFTDELLDTLAPQITDEIQVIVIDDGSKEPYKPEYNWVTLIRQENGGASKARNTGLDNASGEYIAFIDGDDKIPPYYIETLINKIKEEHFDYCYLSWESFGRWENKVHLNSINDNFPSYNLCVWNRVYRKDLIGDVRFNEVKKIAEDAQFIKEVDETGKKKAFISKVMYYYRSDTPDSLTKRFDQGKLYTKRAVYNYNHITKDMTWLIDDVKNVYKDSEVIIMTNQNDLPELEKYAMITQPIPVKGTSFKGEYTDKYKHIELPIETQVVFYTDKLFKIGGIESFMDNWVQQLSDYYDICIVYNDMHIDHIKKLRQKARVVKWRMDLKINCDTVIINRITDRLPSNIYYKKKVQMIHCAKLDPKWICPTDNDVIVPVSKVVADSFVNDIRDHEQVIIPNMTCGTDGVKTPLRLMSATRLTFEKGWNRMKLFAEGLQKNSIPFVWTIFTDLPPSDPVDGMVFMKPRPNVRDYMRGNDYVVQLSDSEAFCYTLVEAMELGVPVITTPIPALKENGFIEGKYGITVPFDMNDIDYDKIVKGIKPFKFSYDNQSSIEAWRKLLGNTTPKHDYVYDESEEPDTLVTIRATGYYNDLQLHKAIKPGDTYQVTRERAKAIASLNKCVIL